MIKRKNVISIIVILILIFTLSIQVFAGFSFVDIEEVNEKDQIISLYERGIVKGTGQNKFSPEGFVTVAEGVQLIVNTFELNIDNIKFIKQPKATDYFINADDNAWYANALIIASINELEILKDLYPDNYWTKEEFTYYLVTAMEQYNDLPKINIISKDIADEDSIKIEYSGAIQRSLVYGITSLDTDEKFNAKEKITRAQAAEQVYNALEYIKSHPAPEILN